MHTTKGLKNILTKSQENKIKKEKKLFEAAYDLFTTKGVNDTAISDIVKKAGVAKGTFYLYFKDKYDIIDLIVLRKSSNILKEAFNAANNKSFENYVDAVIFSVDYIIEVLRKDKKLLKLIYKNLSWGIFRKALTDTDQYEDMRDIVDLFLQDSIREGKSRDEAEKNLFIILELVSSVVYSSLILEEPDTMDNMKPILFSSIRRILEVR